MPFDVRLPTVLRQHAGGQATVQAHGDTLADAVEDLVRQFLGLAGQVVSEKGILHRFVNVDANDDDVISILPAVAGG